MGKFSKHDSKMEAHNPAQAVALDAASGPNRTGQPNADMLDYVADMLAELKVLAESTRCETLTGLIDLAAREAQIRHRNIRQLHAPENQALP
jgi:hypothetical protein